MAPEQARGDAEVNARADLYALGATLFEVFTGRPPHVGPTPIAILARLEREDNLSISALAEPFSIKLPAVMKHLDVLGKAGLITRSKHGRTVEVRLSAVALRGATEWLRRYEIEWDERYVWD